MSDPAANGPTADELFQDEPLLFPFPGPHFVAVNNKNEIIVTDFHNHSVKVKKLPRFWCVDAVFGSLIQCHLPSQVYNADGEFLFKFGSHGEGNGQFNAPTGVAVDSNGNIIVADWGNSRIQARLRPPAWKIDASRVVTGTFAPPAGHNCEVQFYHRH